MPASAGLDYGAVIALHNRKAHASGWRDLGIDDRAGLHFKLPIECRQHLQMRHQRQQRSADHGFGTSFAAARFAYCSASQ